MAPLTVAMESVITSSCLSAHRASFPRATTLHSCRPNVSGDEAIVTHFPLRHLLCRLAFAQRCSATVEICTLRFRWCQCPFPSIALVTVMLKLLLWASAQCTLLTWRSRKHSLRHPPSVNAYDSCHALSTITVGLPHWENIAYKAWASFLHSRKYFRGPYVMFYLGL